jgi:hypothetical protein
VTDPPNNHTGSDTAQGRPEKDVRPILRPPSDAAPEISSINPKNTAPKKECRWTKDPPMFWVTLAGVIAVIAYTSVAAWQACLTRGQLRVMQGQLDAMETDKRPWLRSDLFLVNPIIFSDWNGNKGISVRTKINLKNYGQAPAINVRVFPEIATHPGNTKRQELDGPQQVACQRARTRANENPVGGVAIFPGETYPDEQVTGISGIYRTDDPILFSVFGCVDYSYGSERHGQTGFRMLLGREVKGRILGLPFIEGEIRPYPEPIPPELLATGYPKDPPKLAELDSGSLIFRPDEGGNYAK